MRRVDEVTVADIDPDVRDAALVGVAEEDQVARLQLVLRDRLALLELLGRGARHLEAPLAEDHLDAGLGMADDLLIRAEAAETRQQLRQPRSTQVLNRVRSIRAYQLKLIDDLDERLQKLEQK